LKSNCKSKLLKPAQRHFADEWLIDHNGTRAYKAAYASIRSDTTAKAAASRLLTNVNVDAYIQARQAELSWATENDGKMKGKRREHRGRNDGAPSRSLTSS